MRDLREALRQERDENTCIYSVNVALYRANRAVLENDLRVFEYLRQHPGTPEEKLPGVPVWTNPYRPIVSSVWKNAQQTQALSLFPRAEAAKSAYFYDVLAKSEANALQADTALLAGAGYAVVDPDPSHLTPVQIDQVIESIKQSFSANRFWGVWLAVLGEDNPDFPHPLTRQEVKDASGWIRSPKDEAKLSAASAQTRQALPVTEAALAEANAEAILEAQKSSVK